MSDEPTGYMCTTDFECELYFAEGGSIIYPSVENLRKRRKCVDGCGIVAVRVDLVRVVQEGNDP